MLGPEPETVGLLFLARDVAQAFFQGGDFAEPLHATGLIQAFLSVILDLQQTGELGEVHSQHGAADTGVLMLAGGAVGAVAGAECDLSETEMIAEFCPFRVGRLTVFLAWPFCPPLVNELPVMPDHLGRVNGHISLSCIQVEMAEQSGGDMDRQAAVDGLGRRPAGNHAG